MSAQLAFDWWNNKHTAQKFTVHFHTLFVIVVWRVEAVTHIAGMRAGSLQASQQATHDTPAPAQAVTHTPSAPQRQAKSNVSASALTQMHKLQLHSPSTESTQGVTTPAAAAKQAGNGTGARSADAAAGHLDAKTLIHQEFARLMTTKKYTPNEAAVLAIQNVRTR